MSDCPHATKDGFHWCALGPRGRPTVACSMWRAGGSQNWQHGWGDCPRVLRRVVRVLVEAGRAVAALDGLQHTQKNKQIVIANGLAAIEEAKR